MATTIATRWFTARRGFVLGILGAGNAAGQLIFLMPAAWIAHAYGWRMALVPPMLTIVLLALLVALLAVDRRVRSVRHARIRLAIGSVR
jgi:nitrate/nitrite transporter NarK